MACDAKGRMDALGGERRPLTPELRAKADQYSALIAKQQIFGQVPAEPGGSSFGHVLGAILTVCRASGVLSILCPTAAASV